ncbi:hypothetical protein BDW74DRAFT_146673, partial [Aspergillus multicolor]|uniref:uncharacterized protein n=1 Tax=Aspergillus multicolor TaxID=41759 RepID=UPI003CCD28FB
MLNCNEHRQNAQSVPHVLRYRVGQTDGTGCCSLGYLFEGVCPVSRGSGESIRIPRLLPLNDWGLMRHSSRR